ncbi:MAG: AAA family ATPase, partial [Planctomycetota bacterium]
MITKLRVKNFRCLADTGDLAIRPLTFLVGPNSSGKSSLLDLVTMLRQTVVSPEVTNPLVANGPLVEAGAYPDFVFGHDARRDIQIEIECPKTGYWVGPIFFRAAFGYDAETTDILLKESEFRRG